MCVSPAVEKLRKSERVFVPTADEAKNRRAIENMRLQECCGEILCSSRTLKEPFGISLLSLAEGPADPPLISVRYDPSHPGHVSVDDKTIPIYFNGVEEIQLHMYIDGSVIELIVNRQAAYTKRFYYPGPHAPAITVRVGRKSTNIARLKLWQLTPISPNRLTA